ncbi:MAG: Tetratricopeptide 2 repeat protein [Verrucomicrobiales bacterium]|nr:Tetratricopeptide 2 repeat protein [Verrucomicrobiales bacterium]
MKSQPPSTGTAPRSFYNTTFFAVLFLIIATVVIYSPVQQCGFTNYDDEDYVTANDHVKAGITQSGIKWAFTTGFASNWHPLTWLSHMFDVQCFGLNPAGHHWMNVLFHTAATVFLFLALFRMTAALWPSLLVAALFGWHPMHVESVAWIAERKDVLSAFFAMLTLWLYSVYVKVSGRKAGMIYTAVLLCFGLGLMAKPMLVTLPFVLLLLDFWPLRRFETSTRTKLILEKVPLLMLSVASSVVTFIVQNSSGSVRTLAIIPLDSRIFNSLISYWRYLGKLFWPAKLAVFYPMPEWVSGWVGVLAGVTLLAISILVFVRRKNMPAVFVGWFWFVGTLVPVIGIVQVGAQAMADRYSYIPSIGIFLAVAWFGKELAKKKASWNSKIVTIAVVTVGCCVVLTAKQIPHWRSTATLFKQALAVTENNYVAHNNLGSALMQEHAMEEALQEYEKALVLKDDLFEAHYGAAVVLDKQGKRERAAEHYRAAILIRPDNAAAHDNLGSILLNLGQTEEAIRAFKDAIAADPNYAEPHYNLGVALAKIDADQSILEYSNAVRLRPDYADARNNLGVALVGQRKYESAAEQLQEVVKLRFDDAEAHFNLSFVMSKLGRTNEAKEHYETAFRLNPNLMSKKK